MTGPVTGSDADAELQAARERRKRELHAERVAFLARPSVRRVVIDSGPERSYGLSTRHGSDGEGL